MIELAVREFGRLDILVNDAGIMDDNTAIADLSNEMMFELFRVNTFGSMYACAKPFRHSLRKASNPEVTLSISHPSARFIKRRASHTAPQKLPSLRPTRNTAFMYLDNGIRCNAISPGGVLTDIPLVMPPANEFGFGRTSSLLAHSPEMGMRKIGACCAVSFQR